MLSLEDRMAITELIALHGHLVDDGRLDELNLVFAEDVTRATTRFSGGCDSALGHPITAAHAAVYSQRRFLHRSFCRMSKGN